MAGGSASESPVETAAIRENIQHSVYLGFLRLIQITAFVVCLLPLMRWAVDYLTAAETTLSLGDAVRVRSVPHGLSQSIQAIGRAGRVAIFAHAPSRLEWTIQIRPGSHDFRVEVALDEQAWSEGRSDGVVFRGLVRQGGAEREMFEIYIDPQHEPEQRRWVPIYAPLQSDGSVMILALETRVGPANDPDCDWAFWGEPQILEKTNPPDLRYVLGGSCVFLVAAWLRWRGREKTAANNVTLIEVGSLIFLSLSLVVCLTEGIFQLFPRLFPFAAYRYLPENGLRYFREETQRDIYDREIGYLRQPHVRWSWRRQDDLVLLKKVSAAYAAPDPPTIRFETDDEGFRNRDDLCTAPVIALGDSCTEAPHVQAEEAWPSVVSRELGVRVRNLGMSGYSPQQCSIALRRFGLPRKPRVVLFAFFEANDIMDAEQFKQYQESHMLWPEFLVKSRRANDASPSVTFRRLSFSFSFALLKYLASELRPFLWHSLASVKPREVFLFNPVEGKIGGSRIRMAFYDRYLYFGAFSGSEWQVREGWTLTCETLLEMKRLCDEAGADFFVILLPSKGSVYLPLLEADISRPDFERYVSRSAGGPPADGGTWYEKFKKNHRVLNELIRSFCSANGIEYIDLMPALEGAAKEGELVYFPLDTHWNARGHEIAGRAISRRLKERGLGTFEAETADRR